MISVNLDTPTFLHFDRANKAKCVCLNLDLKLVGIFPKTKKNP